eukprot:g5072.t1
MPRPRFQAQPRQEPPLRAEAEAFKCSALRSIIKAHGRFSNISTGGKVDQSHISTVDQSHICASKPRLRIIHICAD